MPSSSLTLGLPLPSAGVAIGHAQQKKVRALEAAMRRLPLPVVGRISSGKLYLDMRGAERLDELLETLANLS